MKATSLAAIALGILLSASALRADTTTSIEVTGIKLIDKDQVTIEAEIRNLSSENIKINPNIWVQTATLKGRHLSNQPIIKPGVLRVILTIYADLITVNPNPASGQATSVYSVLAWEDTPASAPSDPLVLQPGEKTTLSVKIPMSRFLGRDFMTALSKDIWMRIRLWQSPGEPTDDEEQELVKQHHLLTPMEYEQVRKKLAKKYAPEEFTHGNLYKLEMPEAGKDDMVLKSLKAPF